ncbi:MAG TPA: protease complex subunit PrcB family protein [Methylococcus sp.]|nr:protease complex subunit PrcB family protein [Methylococcus sp.]
MGFRGPDSNRKVTVRCLARGVLVQIATAGCILVMLMALPTGSGWAGTGREEPGRISFTLLAEGMQSGIEEERREVIRDDDAFQALWASHSAGMDPAPPPPAIDFSREMLIAVFAGAQPTAGYRWTLLSLSEENGSLAVRLRLDRPGPDCAVAQVLTQPYLLVKTDRSRLPVVFHVVPRTVSCGSAPDQD